MPADRRGGVAQYALLALDISFVAAKNYVGVVVVNALIATTGIVQAQTMRERTSYVIGGTAGALAVVWLS